MFRKNTAHLQKSLFGFEKELSEGKKKKLRESKEYYFYEMIFSKIKEEDFKELYSENEATRPNAPINSMVSAMILTNRKGWSYEELFNHIDFDLLTRTALGLTNLCDAPFCEATIFNFQNRLTSHYVEKGENLFEKVFDSLTKEQLEALKIKTNIQRMDSTLVNSNIRNYSRLQLLVEVIIRVWRILTEDDREKYKERFKDYVKKTSGQYIYGIKGSEIKEHIEKIGKIYHYLYMNLKDKYSENEVFKTFDRVYREHFTIVEEKIEVNPPEKLHSGMLQSPDDVDATYRKKGKEESKGEVINVTETCNPDNSIQLITDIEVSSNNKDDSVILGERIEEIKEKTPDLEELHTDAGYGNEDNDKKMEESKIMHIQTAIKGRKSEVEIKIDKLENSEYEISCLLQRVKSEVARKRNKAIFDLSICERCSLYDKCPTILMNKNRVYYFTNESYLMKVRQNNLKSLPPERQSLRPNVEATIKEIKYPIKHGKLKVRGWFKTGLYAYSMGIFINFGRIYRLITGNIDEISLLYKTLNAKIDEYINFLLKLLKILMFIDKSDFLRVKFPNLKMGFLE